MKISVKEKMKEAEQMSLQYPDVLYRVMDKTGQRAIVTGNPWVYRERIILYVGEVKKTFGATFGNLSMVSIFGVMEKWAVVSLIFVLISVLQNQRTVETMNLPASQ